MDKTNFKILAVRPVVGCKKEFSKILKLGMIYKFYNDYEYFSEKGEIAGIKENNEDIVTKIIHNSTVPEDLYKIRTADGHDINLNISAVVGKNGAGKSTLLELLYLLCYSIAINEGLIEDLNYYLKRFKDTGDHFFSDRVNDIQYTIDGLQVELYFSKGNSIYLIRNGHGNYKIYKYENDNWEQLNNFPVGNLFYTIVINYSIYALNSSLNENYWMRSLFHKNDGYRTPIVINPFRIDGNIDVNTEFHLTQTRILYNLVGDSNEGKYILSKKSVDRLLFNIFPEQLDSFESVSFKNVFDLYKKENDETVVSLFVKIAEVLIGYTIDEKTIEYLQSFLNEDLQTSKNLDKYNFKDDERSVSHEYINYLCLKYTIRKVFRICRQYIDFKQYHEHLSNEKPIPKLKNIPELLEALKQDNSHVTIKLRQILYAVKEKYFNGNWEIIRNSKNLNHKSYNYILGIDDFSSMIKMAKMNNLKIQIEHLLPVAFFKPEFFIKNDDNSKSSSKFQTLSSGEQQLIQSVQSITYHIINVNSVFNSYSKNKIKYEFLNIILDEVELYYHPEYQKKFVSELVNSITKLKIEHIKGINILFSTHSPFLLSDIPNSNILRLQNGEIITSSNELTFGSNIYDLLANDFFIQDGFIGEYALSEIKKILDYTSREKYDKVNHNYYKDISTLIGDDVIRTKLLELLNNLEQSENSNTKLFALRKQMQQIQSEIQNIEKNDFTS